MTFKMYYVLKILKETIILIMKFDLFAGAFEKRNYEKGRKSYAERR